MNQAGAISRLAVVIVIVVIVAIAGISAVFLMQTSTTSSTQSTTSSSLSTSQPTTQSTSSSQQTTQSSSSQPTTQSTSSSQALKPFNIVVFELGTSSDPYSVACGTGISAAASELNGTNGYAIHVTTFYSVSDADIQSEVQSYASQGYQLIIANDNTYETAVESIAATFPNTQFFGAGGWTKPGPNWGIYGNDHWRAEFMAGVVAGAMTKSNIIGYVAAFEYTPLIQGANAYLAGAKMVNPNVKIVWTFTNTWTDATAGSSGAASLIAEGADVIATFGGTMADGAVQGATSQGAYAIGYLHDANSFSPTKVLTSIGFNTTIYYYKAMQYAMQGKLGNVNMSFSIYPYHNVYLYPFHNTISNNTLAKINPILQGINNGTYPEPINDTMPSQMQG